MKLAIVRKGRSIIAAACCAIVFEATSADTAFGETAGAPAVCTGGHLRVGIDIGHSRQRPGAISASGVTEYTFNARFANEVVTLSRRAAQSAVELDMFILNSDAGDAGLVERARNARRLGAQVLLSIHHDSAQGKYLTTRTVGTKTYSSTPDIHGYSLFVSRKNPSFADSRRLGSLIGRSLRIAQMTPTEHHAEDIPGERREMLDRETGLYEAPFTVLASAEMPAVLIEVGVIANETEERELNRAEFRARVQLALIEALSAYCASARAKSGTGHEDEHLSARPER